MKRAYRSRDLQQLCADVDVDLARERLAEIDVERERIEARLAEVDNNVGGLLIGMQQMSDKDGAHGAAGEKQQHLATIRRAAEQYAKVKLAAVVLQREIERYRQQNQGPIIRRAGELFPTLTLGEYVGLRVDFDRRDEPELRCVGVDGADVGVDGLSDGARDQLYLSLRLASLERYAEHAELMPFIADDILIHFDEDRAKAALEVMCAFCNTGQVLMFTHQARHVELAREVVPGQRLTVHELQGGRRRSAQVANKAV